jgi:hypothetical protein
MAVGSFTPTNSFFVVMSASTRHNKKNLVQLEQDVDPKDEVAIVRTNVIVHILQSHKTMHRLPRPQQIFPQWRLLLHSKICA